MKVPRGMELKIDPQESMNTGMAKVSYLDDVIRNGLTHQGLPNGLRTATRDKAHLKFQFQDTLKMVAVRKPSSFIKKCVETLP